MTTLWQLWLPNNSDITTTPILWQLQLSLSSITYLLLPDFMTPHKIEMKKGWEGTAHKLRLHCLSDPITQSGNPTSWQLRCFANIGLRPFNKSDFVQTLDSDFLTNSDFWTSSNRAQWYWKPVEIQFLTRRWKIACELMEAWTMLDNGHSFVLYTFSFVIFVSSSYFSKFYTIWSLCNVIPFWMDKLG